MKTSESINELVAALALARKGFTPLTKDQTADAGKYSYKYSDLAALIEATKSLSDQGLVLIQGPTMVEGTFALVSRLAHKSGQWAEIIYPIGQYDRPQDTGSAISYARRYSRAALLDIAAEADDDGAQAEKAVEQKGASMPTKLKDLKIEPTRNPSVTKYVATFSDGRKASTINEDLGSMLRNQARMKAEERPAVLATIERGKFGLDLTELALVPPSDEQAF